MNTLFIIRLSGLSEKILNGYSLHPKDEDIFLIYVIKLLVSFCLVQCAPGADLQIGRSGNFPMGRSNNRIMGPAG